MVSDGGGRPTTGSSSSAAAPAGTWPRCAPPATARRSRWSRTTSSAAPASTGAASPPRRCSASAEALSRARAGEEYGFEVAGEIKPDFGRMMERKDGIVTQLRDNVEVLLKKAGVKVLRGTGRLAGPGQGARSRQPAAASTTVEADKIILATGSEPARLPMFDFNHPTILTSTEALALRDDPRVAAHRGGRGHRLRVRLLLHRARAPRSPWWRCCRRCCRWRTSGWPSSSRACTASAASRCCSRPRWRASPSTPTTT